MSVYLKTHPKKEYGLHEYSGPVSGDCKHRCGCWMTQSQSGGPVGLDPFGKCPKNPLDGILMSDDGKLDYEYVLEERIFIAESECFRLKRDLKATEPGARKLAKELEKARSRNADLRERLRHIGKIVRDAVRKKY